MTTKRPRPPFKGAEPEARLDPTSIETQIEEWFKYHPPTADQQAKYVALREKARELALLIAEVVPACADRTAAIRKLRESIMTANAAIACGGI